MAEGIVRRHAPRCPSREGKRCRCNSGWEAWVYLRREKKKVRRTFKTKREAQAWRSEALTAARKGELRRAPKDHRTIYEALVDFVAGIESGEIRPRKKERYKPNTIRSYERAVRLRYKNSELGAPPRFGALTHRASPTTCSRRSVRQRAEPRRGAEDRKSVV